MMGRAAAAPASRHTSIADMVLVRHAITPPPETLCVSFLCDEDIEVAAAKPPRRPRSKGARIDWMLLTMKVAGKPMSSQDFGDALDAKRASTMLTRMCNGGLIKKLDKRAGMTSKLNFYEVVHQGKNAETLADE